MASQNKEDTLVGGKVYSINLGRTGLSDGDSVGDTYREGTGGSPDDQGGIKPFGSADAGGPHIQ